MENIAPLLEYAPWIVLIVAISIGGWAFTTWLKVKNGYPLESSMGNALHPQKDQETIERVKLIGQENAQLRAELGSIKDRLATVERIVTDGGYHLDREIEQLRGPAN